MTSLEFNQIRCATTLCQFGRTRNSFVATHFIFLNRIPESNAASVYVVVPERFDQNEEPAGSNKERAGKNPSLVPKVECNRCNITPQLVIMLFYVYFSVFFSNFGEFFSTFLLWKILLIFCLCYYLLRWHKIMHFVVHL